MLGPPFPTNAGRPNFMWVRYVQTELRSNGGEDESSNLSQKSHHRHPSWPNHAATYIYWQPYILLALLIHMYFVMEPPPFSLGALGLRLAVCECASTNRVILVKCHSYSTTVPQQHLAAVQAVYCTLHSAHTRLAPKME